MRINLSFKKSRFDSLFNKLILIFLGIFLTSLIFSIPANFLGETGIWIGFLLCIAAIATGFYYTNPGNKLRYVIWSIFSSLIFIIALLITSLLAISHVNL